MESNTWTHWHSFWAGFVIAVGIIAAFDINIDTDKDLLFSEAREAKKSCERLLPRIQNCNLTVIAAPEQIKQ